MITIEPGDVVFHRPTRETWIVRYVRGDRLAWLGWPPGEARLGDCLLVEKDPDLVRPEILESRTRRIEWCAPSDAQEPVWLILFDDPARQQKMFAGAGAEAAARRAWAEASQAWNCHLLSTARYTGEGLPWEQAL